MHAISSEVSVWLAYLYMEMEPVPVSTVRNLERFHLQAVHKYNITMSLTLQSYL